MNAYLSREEKQSFVRATALVALIEETINGYASAKSTDPEFLKYLRMGRSMLAKALTMRGDALDSDVKIEFAKQLAKLEFICVPRQEAKKAHAEMLALKTIIPMQIQDFEDWYCAVIETTCKRCCSEQYQECLIRSILTKYGVYPIDPEAKEKCQYSYVGTSEAEELQQVVDDTVPAEAYNMAVSELAATKIKAASLEEQLAEYNQLKAELLEILYCEEGRPENPSPADLIAEIHLLRDRVTFCEEKLGIANKALTDLHRQISENATACIEIEPQEGERQSVWDEQDRLPVLVTLVNGQKLDLFLTEYMAMNLLFELQNPEPAARAICAKQMQDELVVIDMQQVVSMQVIGLEDGSWQRQAERPTVKPQAQQFPPGIDTTARERYRVECKCGAEYFCSMNAGRYKARCRNCNETVFADRKAALVPDPMDGAAATLLTNRYWVERNDGYSGRASELSALTESNPALPDQAPQESYRGFKYTGRDKRYADPCNLLE
ncbi:hypothetical protein HSX37_16270|uniref:DUF5651 domain-containing protein n=1 Tax=Dendrosporobacter quercicolus TaxID=146817 RepID=A0A1G9ZSE2_9FIRM|nr:DUF5651 domain-containing protein [Dendrosporobacter quercicolus]NSL49592.1 hypothetical protein [Dendrosporobacter quercicolus DSM 1736]SDN24045.1 hypothetical protein SAMN04488502_11548 [Dendrosporobacter quercicolus]